MTQSPPPFTPFPSITAILPAPGPQTQPDEIRGAAEPGVALAPSQQKGPNEFWKHNPGRAGSPNVMTQFTHDSLIDMMIANPRWALKDLALKFGYKSTVSLRLIINSDAFQARFAKRKEEIVDPILVANIEDRMKGLAAKSAEMLADALEKDENNTKLALEVFRETNRAAGYAMAAKGPIIQQTFVAHLPGPAASSNEWMNRFAPATDVVLKPRLDDAPSE